MLRRLILPMFFAGALAMPVLAQQQPDNGGGQGNAGGNGGGNGGGRQRGQGGGPGGGGGAQFRQRMMDNLKEQLGTNDDEWKVVEPKLTKVMDAQRDARAGGGFGGFGGGRGNRGGGPNGGGPGGGGAAADATAQSPVQKASNDLRQALDNKSASTEEITQKLQALRDARDKARQSLVSAQKDLKEVLTPRQEAVLVAAGMLE